MANANDVYTMTPGSAVAGTLQDILARNYERRQKEMLEQLGQQNTSRRLDIEQQQANTNEGYRQGLESDRAAITAGRQDTLARTKKQAEDWTGIRGMLVPGNPLFDNLPPDQQRGASVLRNFEYDHPLVQDFLKKVITPESPKNDLVPAFRRNHETGDLTPDMIDATPPLLGKTQRQAPRGSEIQDFTPHHETPREGPQLEIVNTKNGDKGVYVAPMGAAGVVKLPPAAEAEGWKITGLKSGTFRAVTTPQGELYDPKAADALVKSLLSKRNDKKGQDVEIRNFINQGIKDKFLRGDVEHYYMNKDDAAAKNMVPASLDKYIDAMAPYEATVDPNWAQSHPQEVKDYQDNLRRLLTMIERAKQGLQ